MEKLFEHTLQQQARELAEVRTENAKMRTQVGKLAELLEKQLACAPSQPGPGQTGGVQQLIVGSMQTTHIGQVGQLIQIMPVIPWDGEKRIDVAVSQIAAAFAENVRLKEYARMTDHEMTDPEVAPPYVTELFVDLVKRGHSDPTARNVYLNPRRADQVLVHMKSGRWEVAPLGTATRLLFDGVARTIHRVTLSPEERRQLPMEAQNALGLAGLLYEDEPDEYAKRAKSPISAHLANTGPALTE